MIQQSIEHDDPIIFCEPKSRYWEKGEVDIERPPAGLFDAAVRREGTDVTVVGYGASVKTILRAAETAEAEGTSLEVIDARSIAPLDLDTMATLGREDRAARRRPGGAAYGVDRLGDRRRADASAASTRSPRRGCG